MKEVFGRDVKLLELLQRFLLCFPTDRSVKQRRAAGGVRVKECRDVGSGLAAMQF